MRSELLPDQLWYRVADPRWTNPVDPTFAARKGGRWNPPGSWPTLYLNGDLPTARMNLRLYVSGWPYHPSELNPETAPVLVTVRLPLVVWVADCHTPDGLKEAGLPITYPMGDDGLPVRHEDCQAVGAAAYNVGLSGVLSRSATLSDGVGRELAWFPADNEEAEVVSITPFDHWFWA